MKAYIIFGGKYFEKWELGGLRRRRRVSEKQAIRIRNGCNVIDGDSRH
jgi:hypothetical protein